MEISSTQWARYENSSIHLGGAAVGSTNPRNLKVPYSTVKYGANIKLTNKITMSSSSVVHLNEASLALTKVNTTFFTTNKQECLSIHKGAHFVDTLSQQLKIIYIIITTPHQVLL